jgi:hypothetical protein
MSTNMQLNVSHAMKLLVELQWKADKQQKMQ